VKLDSGRPFQGREALERQRREGIRRQLVTFTIDDPDVVLLGRETLYRDGERAGWLTSGGFGHTIGKGIGLGYVHADAPVDPAYLHAGHYEIEVATRRVEATLRLRPLYDPKMKRVRS
jgi:4-methylaminobutanoate oxidase (formaldehyde-forming)